MVQEGAKRVVRVRAQPLQPTVPVQRPITAGSKILDPGAPEESLGSKILDPGDRLRGGWILEARPGYWN